ncbi:MAG: DMT family transporter [Coriobacteriales bacterium]|jgi:drug/metabolite transporter (DMT)-like permease|nr:DMT family transporter [Coriobacteriales bacterium]
MKSKQLRSTVVLALTSLIWGLAFVAQKVGMDFVGPFFFGGMRMVLGALTLLIVLLVMNAFGRRATTKAAAQASPGSLAPLSQTTGLVENVPAQSAPLSVRSLLIGGIVCGIIIFAAGSLQQIGLIYTTASKAGFLTALYIVLVPILGIVLKHKTHWNTWVSMAIAVVGLYLLCFAIDFAIPIDGLDAFSLVFFGSPIQLGDVLVLLGALFWAGHILAIDYFVQGLDTNGVMKLCIAQFSVAAVISFGAGALFDGSFVRAPFTWDMVQAALPAILYVGVMSTGIAFTLQAIGQQGLSPAAASIIMSFESVFAAVGGMLLLSEMMTVQEWFGCALMFAAVILSQLPVGDKKPI